MMESSLSRLREIISEKAFVTPLPTTKNKQHCIILQENKMPDSRLVVKAVPKNLVVLKADLFFPLFLEHTERDGRHYKGTSFFSEGTGASKRADFILIDELGKNIVFLELKASKEPEETIMEQLAGAHAVFDYIRRVGAHYFGIAWNSFFGKEYAIHFVGACHTGYGLSKRPTKYMKSGRGDSIRNFLRFSGTQELYYRQLCEY